MIITGSLLLVSTAYQIPRFQIFLFPKRILTGIKQIRMGSQFLSAGQALQHFRSTCSIYFPLKWTIVPVELVYRYKLRLYSINDRSMIKRNRGEERYVSRNRLQNDIY